MIIRIMSGIVLLLVAVIAGFMLYTNNIKSKVEKSELAAALSRGEAVQAQQQVALGKDTNTIVIKGRTRESSIERVNTSNVDKIKEASGADEKLSSSLINTVNNGLCKYESTPGCPRR